MTSQPIDRFEAARPQLRAIAYRMLGSVEDAEDAVQEAWLRLSQWSARENRGVENEAENIANLDAWLTTVVARICLNTLRARRTGEQTLARLPDPIVDFEGASDPEHRALLGDAVGLALLVVLDTLAPAERLAFVLHDAFAVPFEQIAPIVERSPEATRKLASRARRRIQQAGPVPESDVATGREARDVVAAFFAAGRSGHFDRLIAVLHPDVVLRGDLGSGTPVVRAEGASVVAELARSYAGPERDVQAATVNGTAGAVVSVAGRATAVLAFVVHDRRITAIDVLADPDRLARLGLDR
ncbi:sigma-70 family RNA polymerase sigma factor [Mycobacterium vicinigordonae]|uniref:Sigma-70 family RNA polymerase sigma factor n=1 Tax=Mycobacterium vicinigordonae TaxID=1719132 RepID=A0A7D6HSV8_9MYCO|nr:sigma-70 family RNA polymerase sigma factor [Mycobacterium vicinigordonae]QLL05813.1 sigma-70 family RNA polymerase sigma factor [Mycobacterium vicinigordonae]